MEGVAIITGGTKGLGKALVRTFLEADWAVATCARNRQELEQIRQEYSATDLLLMEELDVSDSQAVRAFVGSVITHWGRIDLLINNASVLGPRVSLEEYPEETWESVMAINANGPFYFVQSVLPSMRAARSGVILNISSGAGVKGKPRWGAYAASKFAVEGLSQVLREEVLDDGIRVHAIDPGAMRTEMRAAAYPEEDPSVNPTPETVARVIFDIATVYEPQLARLVAKDYL